jgi:prevent-host-death family protein
MIIKATDFKVNFGKYLDMIANSKEDIFITKNGKTVAKLSNPNISAVDSISGILTGAYPDDFNYKDLREERLAKYEING